MQRIGEILSRVLADLEAQFPQERKALIREGSCAHGHGDREDGRSDARLKENGCCGLPQVHSFTTEPTRPVARVPIAGQPKTSAGDKWDEPSVALELPGGVHDVATASRQARIGTARTETEIQ